MSSANDHKCNCCDILRNVKSFNIVIHGYDKTGILKSLWMLAYIEYTVILACLCPVCMMYKKCINMCWPCCPAPDQWHHENWVGRSGFFFFFHNNALRKMPWESWVFLEYFLLKLSKWFCSNTRAECSHERIYIYKSCKCAFPLQPGWIHNFSKFFAQIAWHKNPDLCFFAFYMSVRERARTLTNFFFGLLTVDLKALLLQLLSGLRIWNLGYYKHKFF